MSATVQTSSDEGDLIARSRKGDLPAFNLLVERYQTPLFNLCLRVLRSPQAAEDATQEAFISAYRALERFRGGSFRAWLFRIAVNACYDELRRRRARPALSLDRPERGEGPLLEPPSDAPTLQEHAERRELERAIQAALARLPEDQRVAVVLCDIQGMDYAEIAEAVGVSLGTVKSRISRARARLRTLLMAQRELLPSRFRPTSEGT